MGIDAKTLEDRVFSFARRLLIPKPNADAHVAQGSRSTAAAVAAGAPAAAVAVAAADDAGSSTSGDAAFKTLEEGTSSRSTDKECDASQQPQKQQAPLQEQPPQKLHKPPFDADASAPEQQLGEETCGECCAFYGLVVLRHPLRTLIFIVMSPLLALLVLLALLLAALQLPFQCCCPCCGNPPGWLGARVLNLLETVLTWLFRPGKAPFPQPCRQRIVCSYIEPECTYPATLLHRLQSWKR